MKIESNRAEVHTATIEVRTILIDKRQLTLSTFRQIPKHPLLDQETGKFAGELWGTVNYFAAGDDESVTWDLVTDPPRQKLVKRHVLFVTEGELRRAPIVEPHWAEVAASHQNRYRGNRIFCFAGLGFGYEEEPPEGSRLGLITDDVKAEIQMAWTEIMVLPQLYIAT